MQIGPGRGSGTDHRVVGSTSDIPIEHWVIPGCRSGSVVGAENIAKKRRFWGALGDARQTYFRQSLHTITFPLVPFLVHTPGATFWGQAQIYKNLFVKITNFAEPSWCFLVGFSQSRQLGSTARGPLLLLLPW